MTGVQNSRGGSILSHAPLTQPTSQWTATNSRHWHVLARISRRVGRGRSIARGALCPAWWSALTAN